LKRTEALGFYHYWSDADRGFALAEIERVGAVDFYAVESGTYVRCNDADGTPLLWLHAGFIDYAASCSPETARPSPNAGGLVPLSRFSLGERGEVRPQRPDEICGNCFEAKSAAGVCSC
jgi:hypothetical protein